MGFISANGGSRTGEKLLQGWCRGSKLKTTSRRRASTSRRRNSGALPSASGESGGHGAPQATGTGIRRQRTLKRTGVIPVFWELKATLHRVAKLRVERDEEQQTHVHAAAAAGEVSREPQSTCHLLLLFSPQS